MASCDETTDSQLGRDHEALQRYEESRKRRRSCDDPSIPDGNLVNSEPVLKREKSATARWNPELDVWDNDPTGFYGLKQEYLDILGIRPPLDKWVHVSNFRCDKSELRDVLELAGHVVLCSVMNIREKYAKVMYSHPLEAVQAVSMLNKQKFYGQPLQVTMISHPLDTIVLPKGLFDIGPGLGSNGKPLRDIVKEYKRFALKKPTLVNTSLFYKIEELPLKTEVNCNDDISLNNETLESKMDINDKEERGDSIKAQLDDFRTRKRFTIRNVTDTDDNETVKKYTSDKSASPDTVNSQKSLSRSDTRPNSVEISSSEDESVSKKILIPKFKGSFNLQSTVPQAPSGYRCPDPKNVQRPLLPPSNPNSVYGLGTLKPVTGPNGPMIRPNAPVICPTNTMSNHMPVGGPVGPNSSVPATNFAMPGPNHPMPGPAGPMGPVRPIGPRPISGPSPSVNVSMPGSAGPSSGFMPGPIVGPMPGFNGPMPGMESTTLQFRNLPPSTTFPILCEKMSQCGQVLTIQMTTPGCATVQFTHPSFAERCFQRYNRACVEGCVIEARFI